MTDPSPQRLAARVANSFAVLQFATDRPEIAALFERAGLIPDRGYFALRLAPLGAIPPPVGAALMPFFPMALVEKLLERTRGTIDAGRMAEVGIEGLATAAEAAFGDHEHLDEMVDLLETAAGGVELDGRPLTGAWSSVEWSSPAARLFGAATVLREHRGEGHFMAVRVAGLSGDEMHVLSSAARGRAPDRITHGYRPEQVEEAAETLRSRGLLDEWTPSSAGERLLTDIELATDRLDGRPWKTLGETGTVRVVELGGPAGEG